MRKVPSHIVRPSYSESGFVADSSNVREKYVGKALHAIRRACALAARMRAYAGSLVKVRAFACHLI